MRTTIDIADLRAGIYGALTGTTRLELVEPDVVDANGDAGCLPVEPGTVMLSAHERHRQLEIVARQLVEAATARRRRMA